MGLTEDFLQITGCRDRHVAERYLGRHRWELNEAINHFFNDNEHGNKELGSGAAEDNISNVQEVDAIFSQYADGPNGDVIDVEGTVAYFSAMGIDVEQDVEALIAAYVLESPSTGVFTRDKFVQNWMKLDCKVRTLEDMAQHLHQAKAQTLLMKEVYQFAFKYALEEGKRKLDIDDAVALWRVLYRDQFQQLAQTATPTTVTRFVNDFVSAGNSGKDTISKDEWNMAYSFFTIPLQDLEKHSESAAWPVLMDEFVEFLFEQR